MKQVALKENIGFEELAKVDIRVGTIESLENVENSKKTREATADCSARMNAAGSK